MMATTSVKIETRTRGMALLRLFGFLAPLLVWLSPRAAVWLGNVLLGRVRAWVRIGGGAWRDLPFERPRLSIQGPESP